MYQSSLLRQMTTRFSISASFSKQLELRIAQRSVDDQQHQIGILGGFGGRVLSLAAVDFAQARCIDQPDFVHSWPGNFISFDRRPTAQVGGENIPARQAR